jgi:hypothetical protein
LRDLLGDQKHAEVYRNDCYVTLRLTPWFQHGSTTIVFAPVGFTFVGKCSEDSRIPMREQLMPLPRVEHHDGKLELIDWAALNRLSFFSPRQVRAFQTA